MLSEEQCFALTAKGMREGWLLARRHAELVATFEEKTGEEYRHQSLPSGNAIDLPDEEEQFEVRCSVAHVTTAMAPLTCSPVRSLRRRWLKPLSKWVNDLVSIRNLDYSLNAELAGWQHRNPQEEG
jgi:hypothetical protein